MIDRGVLRPAALALVLTLAGSACVSRSDDAAPEKSGGKYGSGVSLEGLDEKKKADQKQDGGSTSTSSGGGGTQQQEQQAVQHPGGTSPITVSDVRADDYGQLGRNSLAYLRGKVHKKLVIEINAVEGFEPRSSALSLLVGRLKQVVDKPDGIELLPVKTFPSSDDSYTGSDLEKLQDKYRKRFSDRDGPTAVMHIFYLNGQWEDNPGAGGVAYGSSQAALFKEGIDGAGTPLASAETLEKVVMVHETGHLLGLVNIGYQSPRPHEDSQHSGHSNNEGSVMYWATELLDVADILNGGPPSEYDSDDKADLADRRAGRL